MSATTTEQTVQTLEITQDEFIAAPIELVFATLLEQMGTENEGPNGAPMPMKIEAWPGGRWFRDLGNNSGHLWGHVQAIKAPTLLEICGPLFMSNPVISNVQYRLTPESNGTRLTFHHKAVGQISPDLLDGAKITQGWGHLTGRVRRASERTQKGAKK